MKYLILLILLSGCQINNILPVDYKFGDASKLYCSSNDIYERAQLKIIIQTTGITVGTDYCLKIGLIDRIVNND